LDIIDVLKKEELFKFNEIESTSWPLFQQLNILLVSGVLEMTHALPEFMVYFLRDQGEQLFKQLKNYVETTCLAVKQYLNITYTIADGSVVNVIAVADFGMDINGENSDQTNMIFGKIYIKCY
ncbi:13359_t:CDS:2, partial [Gigaspora margarita]